MSFHTSFDHQSTRPPTWPVRKKQIPSDFDEPQARNTLNEARVFSLQMRLGHS